MPAVNLTGVLALLDPLDRMARPSLLRDGRFKQQFFHFPNLKQKLSKCDGAFDAASGPMQTDRPA